MTQLTTAELIFIKGCLESREEHILKILNQPENYDQKSFKYALEQDIQRIKFITKKVDYMIRNTI